MPTRDTAGAAAAGFVKRHWLVGLYTLLAAGVSAQRLLLHKENNFRIFRSAFHNLMSGLNLYAGHPDQYFDFFRYSPTFALAFGPFAIPPAWLGLVMWNTFNALVLLWAVRRLLPRAQAQLVLLLILGDLARSMQSCESNALVTALMIAAFLAYEGGRLWRGALAVAAGAAVKLFPFGAVLFALLRRDRWRAFGLVAAATVVLFLVLPAALVGPHDLLSQYGRWAWQERAETFKPMYSVMDLLDAWTGYYGPRLPVQLAGLAVLLSPLALRRRAREDAQWRLALLGSLLVFSVLFNYGAEPPSFVISTTGIAIWYVAGRRTRTQGVLVLLTLALVTGEGIGLWPREIRHGWMDESRIRVIPVLAAWIAMQVDLLRRPPVTAPEGVAFTGPEPGLRLALDGAD
jgi:hypothetical protein